MDTMETQDFRRCYSCGVIMSQRSGGLCPLCNPHPDPEQCPESEDEDYDWGVKEIDQRGADPVDYEDIGEPIPGSYYLCHAREETQAGDERPPWARYGDNEPSENLNEKTHAPCEGVDKIVMAG